MSVAELQLLLESDRVLLRPGRLDLGGQVRQDVWGAGLGTEQGRVDLALDRAGSRVPRARRVEAGHLVRGADGDRLPAGDRAVAVLRTGAGGEGQQEGRAEGESADTAGPERSRADVPRHRECLLPQEGCKECPIGDRASRGGLPRTKRGSDGGCGDTREGAGETVSYNRAGWRRAADRHGDGNRASESPSHRPPGDRTCRMETSAEPSPGAPHCVEGCRPASQGLHTGTRGSRSP